jgi:hypothetical protein
MEVFFNDIRQQVYFSITDDNRVIIDEEEMRKEFEYELAQIVKEAEAITEAE